MPQESYHMLSPATAQLNPFGTCGADCVIQVPCQVCPRVNWLWAWKREVLPLPKCMFCDIWSLSIISYKDTKHVSKIYNLSNHILLDAFRAEWFTDAIHLKMKPQVTVSAKVPGQGRRIICSNSFSDLSSQKISSNAWTETRLAFGPYTEAATSVLPMTESATLCRFDPIRPFDSSPIISSGSWNCPLKRVTAATRWNKYNRYKSYSISSYNPLQ